MENKSAMQIIVEVMRDVTAVAKTDVNSQQNFKFRGIDAVINAIGPALRKAGGAIIPNLDSVTYETMPSRSGGTLNVARVIVTYAVHGDSDSCILGSVAAEAFDAGDKATAKAMSVAYRTFLLQLFCLPTDDRDPDHDSYEIGAAADMWKDKIADLTSYEDAVKLHAEAIAEHAPKEVLEAIAMRGGKFPKPKG